MAGYDIRTDFTFQKKGYLSAILFLTLMASIFHLSVVLRLPDFSGQPYWLIIVPTLITSEVLRRRNHPTAGAWTYLLGMLVTFSTLLWLSGPSLNIYLLMLVPLVISIILLEHDGLLTLAQITAIAIVLTTLTQRVAPMTILEVASVVFFPLVFCSLIVGVLYFYRKDLSDIVYWATDIQQKDTKRAETFYEQREQLSEALRQLTHAHARLKTLNTELEIARLKTEHASQAKSIFLSNMSHELRTPLNVVIGYTSTMLDMPQMYGGIALPRDYRADIQLIKDNGYYLLGLINDILDLSKIEAGKLELSCTPTRLADVLRGTLATSIGLVKDKPVQVRPEYPDDLPLVFADANRVRQVILNLMSNAIKFTHTGSVTLKAAVEGKFVRISVIDTGIGIPEKALPHIFDRFEQAERDTDKHYGGTGLGLDISKQLVKMHGGEITVASVVGQGSTFSFTLPLSVEQAIEGEKPPETTAIKAFSTAIENFMPHTILVVEDEASMREMLRHTLEDAGHVVVDIQDGAQVVQTTLGLLPDLIVLDICLPNLSGWDALAELKRNPETAHIPVIVSTVNDDQPHAMALGAALFLHKPFSADELCACVQELLPNKLVDTDKGA
jgi:signal transduction histidine kinase/ActR/RegA family two-component response regulator